MLDPHLVQTPRRIAGAFDAGEPECTDRRLIAAGVDFGLLLLVAATVGLIAVAAGVASDGRLRPGMTGYLTLVMGFQWAHTALLEGFGASAGKRLCGLLVVAGHDGGPVGIARAVLRRAVLDACIGGSACLAFVLTGLRQFANPWPVGRLDGLADYVVLFVFWAALLLPFLLYRTVSCGGQWLHDRVAGAVVVRAHPAPEPCPARAAGDAAWTFARAPVPSVLRGYDVPEVPSAAAAARAARAGRRRRKAGGTRGASEPASPATAETPPRPAGAAAGTPAGASGKP